MLSKLNRIHKLLIFTKIYPKKKDSFSTFVKKRLLNLLYRHETKHWTLIPHPKQTSWTYMYYECSEFMRHLFMSTIAIALRSVHMVMWFMADLSFTWTKEHVNISNYTYIWILNSFISFNNSLINNKCLYFRCLTIDRSASFFHPQLSIKCRLQWKF